MRETGASGWFVIGNDYCWPRFVGGLASRIIRSAGGTVLGQRYDPLGQESFDALIESIDRSHAELVVSALVGRDAVAFERAFYAAGIRARTRTIAVLMDENIREHIGDEAATGIWSPRFDPPPNTRQGRADDPSSVCPAVDR